ncbi:MAG: hypothetical protein HOQ11_16035 [Gemmatimonadaceae bacterium]|nr:hypothetical protein [Gemmatimonadaceae bacterium]NUQ92688.1 hypothetical protein [Gemmatimonadaceae bacterium]NUR19469.1 hypothetical protein [Gemmatimonadaceae bacterium]NUS98911.1 hypothetical protein [Gemmatimonadaceae bacterium]
MPQSLHVKAEDNLRFIRETMERAGSFTAVSGWGEMGIGTTALVAAWLASAATSADRWLALWLGEAAIAVAIAMATTTWKVRDHRVPLVSGPARKFALSFVPPMIAGALLTIVLVTRGEYALLPAVWMLLYGAAVVSAGTFSVRIVPVMGGCFMICGAVALLVPDARNVVMAVAFGGLHLAFGAAIARRHGG